MRGAVREINLNEIIKSARTIYTLHQKEEILPCLEFVTNHNLNGFIEIGSANGGSFHCWASVIPEGPKVSVDWNRGFNMNAITAQHRNSLWRKHFLDVRIVEGDSLESDTVEACKIVLDGDLVDWLFIDAQHTYDSALKDFNNYKQFVRDGGYIGFHDICSAKEMVILWSDLKDKAEYDVVAEILMGHGIGILKNI